MISIERYLFHRDLISVYLICLVDSDNPHHTHIIRDSIHYHLSIEFWLKN